MFSRAWLGLVSLSLLGCSTCADSDHTVPFKRGGSVETVPPASGAEPSGAAPSGRNAAATGRDGQRYGADTRHIEVGGRSLELPEGAIRASLQVQLDDAPSLLLLVSNPGAALALDRAQQLGRGWSPPTPIETLQLPAGCHLLTANLQALDASYAVAQAELECGPALIAEPATEAPAPAPGRPAAAAPDNIARALRAESHQWIVTLEPSPRILDEVSTSLPKDAPSPSVVAHLQSRDLDGDGTADLALALNITTSDQLTTHLEVKLLNRAGGLARDTAEPEASLLPLAEQAKSDRKKNPASARALAERVLAVHGALCREGHQPRLRFGSAPGLDCGLSLAAGRAASVLTALLANQGQLLPALDLYQKLANPAYRLTDNDWDRARQALSTKVDATTVTWQPGPKLASQHGPDVQHAAIAFIDETHVLLRGAQPHSLDVTSGLLEATSTPGSPLVTDPSGRFAVTAVLRSCQGYQLRIVAASQVVAGLVVGTSVAEPLIAPDEPPPSLHCGEGATERRAPEAHKEGGGFRVLGWLAQGILLARAEVLWLVPMGPDPANDEGSGPAQVLGADAALPGLTQPSELTPDGRYLALITPLGIALHDRLKGTTRLYSAADGVAPGAAQVTDVALSPSAQRIAIVRDQQLFIGTRNTAVAPLPSPGATPSAAPPTTPTTPAPSTSPAAAPAAAAPAQAAPSAPDPPAPPGTP